MMFSLHRVYAVSIALLMVACSSSGLDQNRNAQATPAQLHEIESLRATYAQGRYGDVIRQSARSSHWVNAPSNIQIEALKLEAFSYCVTNHRSLCEQKFARILAIDPDFELEGPERGHPQWQRAFDAVKQR